VELVESHGVFKHGPSELGLVVEVRDLLHLFTVDLGSVELLGDGLGRVLELFEELGGDGEVVASGQFGDFTNVSERSTHDDGLVSVLLVVAACQLGCFVKDDGAYLKIFLTDWTPGSVWAVYSSPVDFLYQSRICY
jgi:hypothetical protein